MTINSRPFILLKNIPSERYVPYKDRHRSIHAHNMEVIKHRHKTEKRKLERYDEKKLAEKIEYEKKVEKEVAQQYRLLNII